MRSSTLAFAVLTAAILAQTQTIRVTTRVVEVSVVVRDKNGPVANLTRDDFTLLDQGKPQKILGFTQTLVPAATVGAATAAVAAVPLPPHIYSNRPETRPSIPANTTVILLDALNTQMNDQVMVKKQFLGFLKQIRSTDRVAVYALSTRLMVLHEFTSDSAKLLAAVNRYSGQNLSAVDASNPDQSMTGDSQVDQWLNASSAAISGFTIESRASTTAAALEAIGHHIERLPGRKSLVWITGSFPLSIGDLGADGGNSSSPSVNRASFQQDLLRATKALSDADIAVYPVDARGLIGMPKSMTAAGSTSISRAAAVTAANSNQSQITVGHSTMQVVAENTGGEVFENTNDIRGAIRKAIDDGQVSYTLTFTPDSSTLNGKFHNLKVQVKRPGIEVRYRRGYLALADSAPADQERATAIRDAISSPIESLGITLTAGVEADQPKPGSTRITLAIDPKDVSFAEVGGKWAAGVDVVYSLRASDGHELATTTQGLNINLPREEYDAVMKDGMTVTRTFEAKPEVAEVRIAIYDRATGKTGSITLPPK